MGSPTTISSESSRFVFSETQKRKLHHLFNVLDVDRNGQLQSNDFVNVGKKIVVQLKLNANSKSAQLILLKSHRLFVQLLTDIHNPELSLTLWNWITFFRDQFESGDDSILNHYIHRTSRHIFDLFDVNRDRLISREEYANMFTIYNISQKMVIQGFEELDTNNDNYISANEVVTGLNNFFKSEDENAKGNLIFGEWRYRTKTH